MSITISSAVGSSSESMERLHSIISKGDDINGKLIELLEIGDLIKIRFGFEDRFSNIITHKKAIEVLANSSHLIPAGFIVKGIDIFFSRIKQSSRTIEEIYKDLPSTADSCKMLRCLKEIKQIFSVLHVKLNKQVTDDLSPSKKEYYKYITEIEPTHYAFSTEQAKALSTLGSLQKLQELYDQLSSIAAVEIAARGKKKHSTSFASVRENIESHKRAILETTDAFLENFKSPASIPFLANRNISLLFKNANLDRSKFPSELTDNFISMISYRRELIPSSTQLKTLPESCLAYSKCRKNIEKMVDLLKDPHFEIKQDEFLYHLSQMSSQAMNINNVLSLLTKTICDATPREIPLILRAHNINIKSAHKYDVINIIEMMMDENKAFYSFCQQCIENIICQMTETLHRANKKFPMQSLYRAEMTLSSALKRPKIESIDDLERPYRILFNKMYEVIYSEENNIILKEVKKNLSCLLIQCIDRLREKPQYVIYDVVFVLKHVQFIQNALTLIPSILSHCGKWRKEFDGLSASNPEKAEKFLQILDNLQLFKRVEFLEKTLIHYRGLLNLPALEERISSHGFIQDLHKILEKQKKAKLLMQECHAPKLQASCIEPISRAETLKSYSPSTVCAGAGMADDSFTCAGAGMAKEELLDKMRAITPSELEGVSPALSEEMKESLELIEEAKKLSLGKRSPAIEKEAVDITEKKEPINEAEIFELVRFIQETKEVRKIESFLLRIGGRKIRQEGGSHATWELGSGCRFTLICNGASEMKRGTRQSIANTILDFYFSE